MDKPIQVGDLVIAVRLKPCCGGGRLGWITRVTGFHRNGSGGKCEACGVSIAGNLMITTETNKPGKGFRLSRFKRIPPLEELETIRQTDEITA